MIMCNFINVFAVIFGIGAIILGVATSTAHNVAFGFMAFAVVGADYWDRKSQENEE